MFNMRKMQEQVLYCAIEAQADAETARSVVYGKEGAEPDSRWVNGAMTRLENAFDEDAVKRIRMNCQCGYGMDEKIALVKELMAGASSMEAFAGSDKARQAGLFCENGQLFLQFPFCPCPMLAEVERLRSKSWCQCSAGYSKVLFEQAFGCAVDVTLLKSIKCGDDICLMRIDPLADLFATGR